MNHVFQIGVNGQTRQAFDVPSFTSLPADRFQASKRHADKRKYLSPLEPICSAARHGTSDIQDRTVSRSRFTAFLSASQTGIPFSISSPVLRHEMSAIDPSSAGLTAMPLTDYTPAAWFGPRIASLFLGVLGVIAMLPAGGPADPASAVPRQSGEPPNASREQHSP